MADDDIDVVIVGSGFAGSLIANELAKQRKKIVILEAGDGVPPNINDYMERFYKASIKVPESPYPPSLFDGNGQAFVNGNPVEDPDKVAAGRPSAIALDASMWADGNKSYLVQNKEDKNKKPLTPFSSTYDRVAGGTAHWLGTSLRFVPKRLQDEESNMAGPSRSWSTGRSTTTNWRNGITTPRSRSASRGMWRTRASSGSSFRPAPTRCRKFRIH